MKKNGRYTLLAYFFLLILVSCNGSVNFKLKGHRGASKDIAEAKKRKTFIQSYSLVKNDIDSLNIKEAFVEKGFGYGNSMDETKFLTENYPFEKFQFTIKIEKGMSNIYYNKYAFQFKNAKSLDDIGSYSTYCPIDSNLIKDTLTVYVLDIANKKRDTIGELIFIKDKNR